ncbi:MAG: hypothetical protein AB7D03_05595 [Thiomicrospira sp.]
MNIKRKQQGFILLLFILILLLIGSIKLLSASHSNASEYQYLRLQQHQHQLSQAKHNLLLHSQLTPELYATNSNGQFLPGDRIPGPGYLPCPDTDFDGESNTPCGQGSDYVIGQLPQRIATRHFNLHQHPYPIWYAVDSRYVIQNADYHNPLTKRYAPLNPEQPGHGHLSLDQQTNLIAILILQPDHTPLNPNTFHQHHNHFSANQQLSLTLSHAEWQQILKRQLNKQRQRLCALPTQQPHWFNACNNRQHANLAHCQQQLDQPDNPTGNNWRQRLCS